MSFEWMVNIPNAKSIAVASVAEGPLSGNTIVAIQTSNCDPLQLASGIQKAIELRNTRETYESERHLLAGSNIMVYKLRGPNCSIVQNHTRVLYHGDANRLSGLPEAIEKAYRNS